MPLKVNVGLTKKLGEANYGSRGASVNVEMELESTLVSEPGKLQERIRQLFVVVRSSLAEELNGNANGNGAKPTTNGNDTNGHGPADHNPARNGHERPHRPATQSQVKALHAITKSKGLNLGDLLRNQFSVRKADDLSIGEASTLIDQLKRQNNGGTG